MSCLREPLLLYPSVSNYWNSFRQSRAVATYAEKVAEIDYDTYDQLWAEAQEYNRKLVGKTRRYHLNDEEWEEYYNLLNVAGNGIIGYIENSIGTVCNADISRHRQSCFTDKYRSS